MGKFANELIASLTQAATYAAGRKVRGMRVTKVELPDVKALRRSLRIASLPRLIAFRFPR
jgi:putative transcriptional regulator